MREGAGFFVTVEGCDGSGKTAVCDELMHRLAEEGYAVVRTREPGGTPLSEKLRDLILNPDADHTVSGRAEMLLFLTARVQHLDELILPALREGKVVICERFNDSTIAYQACARGLGAKEVEKLCHLVCGGIEPDCTLLLDIDPKIARGRVRTRDIEDRLEREKLQFHQEVRAAYLHLADRYPERIMLLDAEPPLCEVVREAFDHLISRLASRLRS